MLDFLKNLTKSDEEKQQELFSAYLDDSLTPRQKHEFEARLAEDDRLRADVELAQSIRQQMHEMPRRSVPRSFTLDPHVYGSPRPERLVQAYPFLRAATVMTALFFIIALGLSIYTTQDGAEMAAQSAMEPALTYEIPIAESEIAMEDTVKGSEPAVAESVGSLPEEESALEEEPAAELEAGEAYGISIDSISQLTATLTSTVTAEIEMVEDTLFMANEAEMAQEEMVNETSSSNALVDGATAESAVATVSPTATVSALPRTEATATAVPRAAEPTLTPADEAAIAQDEEQDSDIMPVSSDPVQISRRPTSTNWQVWLIGLGGLLLVLLVVTFLARRRI
ncbi:MAG: hypothetical protein CSB13_04235 [Chloroflexi bacterium]|nr:MAG: hypothetical protein CSB13_04235 [Chloroflexota bacterium]